MTDEIVYCSCGFKCVKAQLNKTKDKVTGAKKKGCCPVCGEVV